MDLKDSIQKYDRSDMLSKLVGFSGQLEQAWALAHDFPVPWSAPSIQNIVIAGMGGSAIGGDIVRCLTYRESPVPIAVVRHYQLPAYVGEKTLVVVSSYSGDTEETLSAFEEAISRRAQIVCISSGGAVARIAAEQGYPLLRIPTGYPPRSALGFLTIPVLYLLARLGFISRLEEAFRETVSVCAELSESYSPDRPDNLALQIAERLLGKIPVIYASVVPMEAVALRWKGQISENAKVLAYANVFPELNHNEIVGWGLLREIQSRIQVICLRDAGDHDRVVKRMDISLEILRGQTGEVIQVQSRGDSLMARLFSLIVLGDFVSYYLALLNRVDPTPVDNITFLKNRLREG
ncbi:MAG: bifunctional phosphoglucose/phosphomannose isomerase [candidate division KSB1 bacterium]|nr:bifunctional phosphoglucose/phosphomannose isomerase [candidate division KSB1 bacterium]